VLRRNVPLGELIGFGVRDCAASTSRDVNLYRDRPQANGQTILEVVPVVRGSRRDVPGEMRGQSAVCFYVQKAVVKNTGFVLRLGTRFLYLSRSARSCAARATGRHGVARTETGKMRQGNKKRSC